MTETTNSTSVNDLVVPENQTQELLFISYLKHKIKIK